MFEDNSLVEILLFIIMFFIATFIFTVIICTNKILEAIHCNIDAVEDNTAWHEENID